MHNVPMGRPLLVLDMYEHAYSNGLRRRCGEIRNAFMQKVNWEEVNRRVER